MKIGYACQNIQNGLTTNKTIRLSAFTEKKFIETVSRNLSHLACIIGWNQVHNFLFFRIGSQIIPLASHPVCCIDWQNIFRDELREIGLLIRQCQMRISMHADQFVVINSPDPAAMNRSIDELSYHCQLLDLMGLGEDAKVQLHVGGVYGNKRSAIRRFIKVYKTLPDYIRSRLVIENDDRLFSVKDCLEIHDAIGIPIIFDNLHHEYLNQGESTISAMQACIATWKLTDGIPMIDYSQQAPGERKGNHIKTLDDNLFVLFYNEACRFDFDLMLEIRDKEQSGLRVQSLLQRKFQNKVTWINETHVEKI